MCSDELRSFFLSENVDDPAVGDALFERFGPGNVLTGVDRPFERFREYEHLLECLRDFDADRYQRLHKGTAFFFLSWLALQLRNYERAVVYMEAALSEDVRKDPGGWLGQPAGKFLRLRAPELQVCQEVAARLRNAVGDQLVRFNHVSGLSEITVDGFVQRFVDPLLANPDARSVVTAMLVHVLDYQDNRGLLSLRSAGGGALQPLITHLFQGGLVFESLLKLRFPARGNGARNKTLRSVFQDPAFTAVFPKDLKTGADSLQEILNGLDADDVVTAFETTARIRNTTGHNLVWGDAENVLGSSANYERLVEQEWNALLYLLSGCYP